MSIFNINNSERQDMSLITKEKFGITFHKNMSLKDMANKWVNKVSDEIKQKYPEINILFNSANIQIQVKDTLRQTQTTADTTYKTLKGVIEDAVAILTGQVTQPAVKAAGLSTKLATEAQVAAENVVTNEALDLLSEV